MSQDRAKFMGTYTLLGCDPSLLDKHGALDDCISVSALRMSEIVEYVMMQRLASSSSSSASSSSSSSPSSASATSTSTSSGKGFGMSFLGWGSGKSSAQAESSTTNGVDITVGGKYGDPPL